MRPFKLLSTTGIAALLMFGVASSEAQPTEWPRAKTHDDVRIVLHQPQIDSWVFYTQLEARLAIEVTPKASDEAFVGALKMRGTTRTDLDSRRVLLTDIEVVETSFPTLGAEEKRKWDRWLASNLRHSPQDFSLDEILAYLEHTEATAVAALPPIAAAPYSGKNGSGPRGGALTATVLAMEPPAIHFSTPAQVRSPSARSTSRLEDLSRSD